MKKKLSVDLLLRNGAKDIALWQILFMLYDVMWIFSVPDVHGVMVIQFTPLSEMSLHR
jgi:hypothetical protein